MIKYYCRPIKLYVFFFCRELNGYFEVLLFGFTNGVLLYPITMPLPTGRSRCAYINNKEYPWLSDWLIEKGVAMPTYRCLTRDNFSYREYKFKKEI